MQTNRQIATDERGEDLLHTLKQEVESRFNDIALNRMADVPVLNHEIRVEFCFCRAVPCALAGILITPWFMSVYCFPESETNNGRLVQLRYWLCRRETLNVWSGMMTFSVHTGVAVFFRRCSNFLHIRMHIMWLARLPGFCLMESKMLRLMTTNFVLRH